MNQPVFTLDDAIRGIRKRKFQVGFLIVLVPTVVLIATLLATKQYRSSSKLFVRLGRENAAMDATATLGQGPVVAPPLSREAEIRSIAEMIRNRSLFGEVVDEIGPERILKKQIVAEEKRAENQEAADTDEAATSTASPGWIDQAMGWLASVGVINSIPNREKAIIELDKNLSIEPIERSNVILIEYESYSPELSRDVVDLVVEKYMVRHGEIHRSTGVYSFLDEQTQRLENELRGNERKFESLKQESGVVDIDAQRQVLVNRLAKIRDEKLEVDAECAALRQEVERLRELKQATPQDMVLEETIGVGNEGVDGMRQELYRLELQREDLLAKLQPTHSRVQAIEQQIEKASRILEEAEQARKESRRGPSQVFQQLEIGLNTRLPQLQALEAKSKAYQAQIEELSRQQQDFAVLETEFNQLNRRIAIEDANYRKYVNNLEEAKIDSLLKNQNLSNLSVAQPPTLEYKPSKPNKLLNVGLGVVCGLLIAVGWAVYREFQVVMSTDSERLAREAELPIAGSLPTLPAAAHPDRELVSSHD